MVVTEEPVSRSEASRTLLAGPTEGELRPVTEISDPPLKSMPGLRPTVPRSSAQAATMSRAMEYHSLRLPMKGMEVRPA